MRSVRASKTIPDGFAHYYVPTSSCANFLMLYIIQPKHKKFFLSQAMNLTHCLRYKMKRLDMLTLGECFKYLTGDSGYPVWILHIIGFVVVGSVLLLVAFFMMILCPCLMCWQINFGEVVQAGKLDTYSHVSWAMITLFGYLSILFAAFGVLSVGCAGIGMGYYLRNGTMTHIYDAYDEIQGIALEAVYLNDQTNNRRMRTLKVLFSSLLSATYKLQDSKPEY